MGSPISKLESSKEAIDISMEIIDVLRKHKLTMFDMVGILEVIKFELLKRKR